MTDVNTPNVGALPRQRNPKLGSIGAIALVIAVGAAIAVAISAMTDEAPATPVVSHTSTELLERQAKSGPAMSAEQAADEALGNAVKQGQVPAQALANSTDQGGLTQKKIEEAAKRSHATTKALPSSIPSVD